MKVSEFVLQPAGFPVYGINIYLSNPKGQISLLVMVGKKKNHIELVSFFIVIDITSAYNALLGYPRHIVCDLSHCLFINSLSLQDQKELFLFDEINLSCILAILIENWLKEYCLIFSISQYTDLTTAQTLSSFILHSQKMYLSLYLD